MHDVVDGCILVEQWLDKRSKEGPSHATHGGSRWDTTIKTCWMIWKARCHMVYQRTRPDGQVVAGNVRKMMADHIHANNHSAHTAQTNHRPAATNWKFKWFTAGLGEAESNVDQD